MTGKNLAVLTTQGSCRRAKSDSPPEHGYQTSQVARKQNKKGVRGLGFSSVKQQWLQSRI